MGHRDIDMIARWYNISRNIQKRGSVGRGEIDEEKTSLSLSLSRWVVKARVGKSLSEKHGKDGGPSSFRFLGLKEICCLRRNWLPLKFVLIPFVRGNIRKKKKKKKKKQVALLKIFKKFPKCCTS